MGYMGHVTPLTYSLLCSTLRRAASSLCYERKRDGRVCTYYPNGKHYVKYDFTNSPDGPDGPDGPDALADLGDVIDTYFVRSDEDASYSQEIYDDKDEYSSIWLKYYLRGFEHRSDGPSYIVVEQHGPNSELYVYSFRRGQRMSSTEWSAVPMAPSVPPP